MPDLRLRLRADLVPVRAGDGDGDLVALYDGALEHRIELGPVARSVVPALDGTKTAEEVVAGVVALGPAFPQAKVESALRSFLLLNLMEGSGTAIVERARSLRQGAPVETVVQDGSRFACQGSGECCQNYAFGPLGDGDVAKLEALPIAAMFPHLGVGPWYEVKATGATTRDRFLKTRDERCVFLQGDLRCGLHAAFGPESKPAICRLYPFHPILTIEGLLLADVGECASFATSSRTGPLTVDEADAIRSLASKRMGIYHPIVIAGGTTPVDFGHFLRLKAALSALVARGAASPRRVLAAVSEAVSAFGVALAACPLRPGEPDATIESLASGIERFVPAAPPALQAGDYEAVATVADALMSAVLPDVLRAKPSPTQLVSERLARQFAEVVTIVHALALGRAGAPGFAVPAYFREVAAVSAAGGEAEAVLALSLGKQLFGDRMLLEDRPEPGVLRAACVQIVTIVGAKLRANGARRARVEAADLSWGHMLAQRLLRSGPVAKALVVHQGLTAAFVRAGGELAWGEALPS